MIFDYEECQKILDKFSNTIIKEVEPLGYSSLEIEPIRHFTLGNGRNNVIVSACQHSNEIITTTFIIYLMNYLVDNNIVFEDLTIHFIPILNPEGYIVNTSAIRDKLSRDANNNEIVKFCYEFYKNYKYDVLNKNIYNKRHQDMFKDVDYRSISNRYNILRDSVFQILSMHPKGSIIDWASNGNGIDLNSNSVNKHVDMYEFNRQNQYNNIRIDIPSPIGHPGKNNDDNFQEEVEVLSLKKLFNDLSREGNLLGYLNYHSTGGIIYQRPEDDNNYFTILYNYLLSKFYQEYTVKNNSKYDIVTNASGNITSVNDYMRVRYPGNLLIELSPMMGNSIGVFGDINNFNNTINCNINSFIYVMNNISNIYSLSNQLVNDISFRRDIYSLMDNEYDNLLEKKLIKKIF